MLSNHKRREGLQLAVGLIWILVFVSSLNSLISIPTVSVSNGDLSGPVSYELARKQSFEFFTDIPDEQWRIAQEIHAKSFPNHFGNEVSSKNGALWYAENFQEEFHCAHARRIPSTSSPDGPKWICDPHRISEKSDCLVYSVGSNGNVEFELGVKEEIGNHCEIHTFDIVSNKMGRDFNLLLRNIGATFHHWGIGTKSQADEFSLTKEGPPLYTLEQTITMLNHTDRAIDIFKIDCESCEWEVYSQFINTPLLRQILVETHLAPMPQARDFFYELHNAGYVIFSKEANYQWGGNGVEFAFLKLHPDFFVDNTTYALS